MSVGLSLATTLLAFSPASLPELPAAADSTWTHKGVVVRMHDGPARSLEWEFFLAAPVDAVWHAWVTPDGLTTWAGPAALVDLRAGGTWEVHFNPDRPAGERGSDANEIVSFEAGRFLHIKAGAPLEFPTIREQKTDFTVTLEALGSEHTRVVVRQGGWLDGDEWDRGYRYLADANAEWLSWMVRRYISGPLEWPSAPARSRRFGPVRRFPSRTSAADTCGSGRTQQAT
ncbi:MAG: SRPBCC domain-containing protein [Gemmatimonadota bacterium]